jgi:hypothetical protein
MENLKHIDVKHLKIPTARVVHDAAPEVPFWGWPTATIDWCEESISPISCIIWTFVDD